ncbi:MAG TPA: TldD/PmbA family protein [bacterium (Candidatus Stahlbacteria)]|nr:TldD/PmbA family protein [Candidatus Stahlbacteria bacterium]
MIIRNLKREVRTPPGSYPVIIMPIPLSTIITGITVGINGKSLDRGYSPLTDKIGKKVVSEKVTVYDDGLRPFGFRSGPFDGEGVARKKRVIFDKGVFKNFLFDLETGAKRGLPSTGNAQRSYSSLPSPGPNNLVMEPGHGDLDQTISGIDRGIIVCGVVGGGHGNIYAGDFSVKLDLGFLIEKGEIRGRLTETMMAGNIYNVLLNVIEIGDYQKDLGGEYLPWILTSELNFTAS